MNPEVVNLYIDVLIKEVEELTKSRLLITTQLKYTEKMNSELNKKIIDLESQIEKQSKKSINKKEVNTSDTF